MARVQAKVRREQLIDAAVRVATRDGVAAATTRAIATEAGASLASVHYCFESKQELLQEVLISIINELASDWSTEPPAGASVADMLRADLGALWAVVEREPGKQQVTYELTHYALRTEGLEELAQWQYQVYYARSGERLRQIAARAGVEWTVPLPTLTRMLMNMIDGLVLGWLVDRDSKLARGALEAFADTLGNLTRRP
ncbi:MAG TPA: TetR family transcriptional regulator [Pseudonocardia sp.]|jgi:AcrR family transcriptional regulator|uniref:TetR/AcrR family transcriptional regulator n=1 Tax=Pseudonocardia sp. TaxID=60912 RepID=UPI002C88B308|nr:TetR family transcriptional regulator [Pseudonocardia sp.]HTF51678.1 TetR family transcriptional regulator [Pseudonocardia sp.]